MKQLPIACSLDAGAARDQLAAWRALAPWERAREEIPDGVRVVYALEVAGDLERVAVAERACCGFLEITVELVHGELVLTVRAPDAALAQDVRKLGVA